MIHELKIQPEYFEAVLAGDKTFEIRKNDRGFQKGDKVVLIEFDHTKISPSLQFSGRTIEKLISYVSHYEQKEGYCVFGLKDILK